MRAEFSDWTLRLIPDTPDDCAAILVFQRLGRGSLVISEVSHSGLGSTRYSMSGLIDFRQFQPKEGVTDAGTDPN